ncbi:hypothetical protein HC928_05300 [bacterium]|nr:hypothetical protein [bacterium]
MARGPAQDAAIAIADEWPRAEALCDLAPHLPPAQQPVVLASALDAASAIADDWLGSRADALRALAPYLPRDWDLLSTTISTCAARGRSDLLSDLTALIPWLAQVAPTDALADVAQSLSEVARCWS